jgi:hypothetical protein
VISASTSSDTLLRLLASTHLAVALCQIRYRYCRRYLQRPRYKKRFDTIQKKSSTDLDRYPATRALDRFVTDGLRIRTSGTALPESNIAAVSAVSSENSDAEVFRIVSQTQVVISLYCYSENGHCEVTNSSIQDLPCMKVTRALR